MITHTLTSDPSIGLELGRRLAVKARRPARTSRLHAVWTKLFSRHPVKLIAAHV